jgi:serine/threonine protein kinase
MAACEMTLGSVAEFSLVKRLGEGAFGSVFLGRADGTTNYVAIKSARRDGLGRPVPAHNRLISTEAVLLKQLSHPNIVKLYRTTEEAGVLHLVLELVAGQDLEKILVGGPVSPKEAADIFKHLMAGLSYLHGRGMVHRDIKPSRP